MDQCLFTKDDILLLVCVDDAVLISPDQSLMKQEIASLKEDCDLTDDGKLKDCLGTRFTRHNDGSVELTQPKIIERVLEIVGLDPKLERVKKHNTPADCNKLFDKDPNAKPRLQSWHCRSAVGCLGHTQSMV